MDKARSSILLGAAVLVALAAGCNWAPLSAEGEQVQFANQKAVESCREVGKTTARTKDSLWIFPRSEETIREELRSLARNDAALMGGTTVSPLGPAEDGQQRFGIYVCGES
jgi:hypothetical protein